MSHITNLLTNNIRELLEKLSRSGVGYVDCEYDGKIEYKIDNEVYIISIRKKEDDE